MTSVALKIAAATLVGGLVAIGVVPTLIDWSSLRPGIERTATAAVGWPVTVAGPVSARLLPGPAMTLHRVTVGAVGFESVRLDLGLWPLLAGRIAVTGVELGGGRLGGGLGLDGAIHLGEIFAADGRFDGGFTAKGHLTLAGIALPVEAEGGRPGGGAAVPLRATVGLPGASGGDLRIEATLAERQAQGKVRLALPSLARAVPGAALPDLPLTAEGRLVLTGEEAGVQGITVALGESRAGGEIVAALGRSPVAIDVSLRAGGFDLDQAPAASAAATPDSSAPSSRPVAAAAPIVLAGAPMTMLRLPLPGNLTFNLDIAADAVRWRGGVVRQPRLNALLDNGVLTVSQLSAQLPGATSLDFNGLVTMEEGGPVAAGRLRVVSADPPRLRAWVWPGGGGGPWPASARLDATLDARSDRLSLSPLTLGLESLRLTGSVDWSDALNARLAVRGLDLGFVGDRGAGLRSGNLTLRGPSFTEAVRLLVPDYRAGRDGPLELTARLTEDAAGPGFDDIRLAAGGSSLIGQIRFPADGPIAARIAGDEVRLDPFLPPETRITPLARLAPRPSGGGGGGDGAMPPVPPAVPRGKVEAVPLARLPAATVDLDLASLRLRGMAFAPLSAHLAIASGGGVTIDRLKAQGLGGAIEGKGHFGGEGVMLDLALSGLEAGGLGLSAGPLTLAAGRLDGHARLSAAGLGPATLAATLGGEARLEVRGGEIRGFDLAAANGRLERRDLAGLIGGGLSGGTTRFSLLSATLKAEHGTVSSPDLTLTADGGRLTGAGSLDLAARRVDGRLSLAPAGAGLPPLGITLRGRLDSPDMVFDANALQRALSGRR